VVMCLGHVADLHMAQLMPLPLTISCSSKSRLVLPFWYRLTRVAHLGGPGQNPREPSNSCVCMCVFLIVVTGENRNLKFGADVDHKF